MTRKLYAADLFCGAGGTSTGLLRAAAEIGMEVDLLAVNHWPAALATHELNHPGVRHIHEDLAMIDPRRVVPRGKLDLLWASPECTSHSYSRGGRPISEQSRSTAWHPLKWCDQLNVKTVIIENVPAFRAWGPTDRNGNAIKKRKGETFQHYIKMLQSMGYTVDHRILNAADFGAAQTRRRLFIVGVKGDHRIQWPRQTHAQPGMLLPGMKPWRGAKEVIDWSIKGRSIFQRIWEGKKPHARKTVERILIGIEKFGPALKPFIPILRNHLIPRDIDEPLPTVAANGTHIGLAEPVLVQVSHGNDKRRGNEGRTRSTDDPLFSLPGSNDQGLAEPVATRARPVSEPMPTVTGSRETGLADFVVVHRTHNTPKSVDEPLPCLNTGGHLSVVEPMIVSPGGAWEDRPQSTEQPLRSLTGTESRALVEPIIVGAGGPEGQGRTAISVEEPLKTVLTENHQALVETATFMLPQRTFENMTADDVEKPLRTLTTKQRPAVVESFVMKTSNKGGNGKYVRSEDDPLYTLTTQPNEQAIVEAQAFVLPHRVFDKMAADSIDAPLRAITGSGGDRAVVEPQAFVVPHRHFDRIEADSVEDPLRTLTTTARDIGVAEPYTINLRGTNKSALNTTAKSIDEPLQALTGSQTQHVAEPYLIPFNGERDGQAPRSHSIKEPLPTICSGSKGLIEPHLLHYGRNGGPRSAKQPLDTLTTKPSYGLVTPEFYEQCDSIPVGALTQIGVKIAADLYLDILFRMLRVHELGQGQGFPKDYKFTGTVEEQVKQIGNAVEVHQAEALCSVVLPKKMARKTVEPKLRKTA